MTSDRFYAGIGSRKTPPDVLAFMTQIAAELETYEMVLRSGGAGGADEAFEAGVRHPEHMEIFLPWDTFNDRRLRQPGMTMIQSGFLEEAGEIAALYHPAWHNCSQGAKALHTRNVGQILGDTLNKPVRFVICWTPRGSGSGGTGQALRLAHMLEIPVFDLGSMTPDEVERGVEKLIE